jgi:hypothetical protein
MVLEIHTNVIKKTYFNNFLCCFLPRFTYGGKWYRLHTTFRDISCFTLHYTRVTQLVSSYPHKTPQFNILIILYIRINNEQRNISQLNMDIEYINAGFLLASATC